MKEWNLELGETSPSLRRRFLGVVADCFSRAPFLGDVRLLPGGRYSWSSKSSEIRMEASSLVAMAWFFGVGITRDVWGWKGARLL